MSKVFAHRELRGFAFRCSRANGSTMLVDVGDRVSRCFRERVLMLLGLGRFTFKLFIVRSSFIFSVVCAMLLVFS